MGNTVICQLSSTRRRSSRRSKKKLHATGDAFLCSAEIGDERMMQALHSANQELDLLQYTDISGQTALHYAAADGQLKCVEFLLQNGCDLNIRDVWQRTPLMKAIVNKQREAAQFLIDHGCDVNLADSINSSALHVAASYGDACIVSLLIAANARVDVVDSKQRQPLYYAVLNSAVDVVHLLLHRGATAFEYDDASLSVGDSDFEAEAEPEFPIGSSQFNRRVQPNQTNGTRNARTQSANRGVARSNQLGNAAGTANTSGQTRTRNRERGANMSRAASRNGLVLSGANVQLSPTQLAVYQLCRRTRANANAAGAIERKANVVRALMADCVVDFETWLGLFTTYSDRDASELCVHNLLHAAVMCGPPRRTRTATFSAPETHASASVSAAPVGPTLTRSRLYSGQTGRFAVSTCAPAPNTQTIRVTHSRSFGDAPATSCSRSLHSLVNQMATVHAAELVVDYLDSMRRHKYVDEMVERDELIRCASGRAVFTLKNLCRLRIRALLAHRNAATNIRPFVDRLPIPAALNQFLRLHDLLDLSCRH